MSERDLGYELRHRRQRRKTATTIFIVLLMLFFAFWYAFSYYRASSDAAPAATDEAGCRPYDPKVPTPATTTVNVYNATTRSGLAARTANELRGRGYLIGEVSNDPLDRTVAGPAEVRFGPEGASRAKLLLPLGGKGTTQLADKRKGAVVDLVVGAKFTTLAPAPSASGPPMCPAPTSSGATPTPAG
ncbi:LytR C-terminal domain-containing protein [Knoellia sp. CPCC 206435]|uniref:LytR C-terminal domain-containing protein n=1 Tax=Knoellia terrae TaxID=3404797 RepID=UPI003B43CABB